MTKNTKIILFVIIGLGMISLVGYGLFSSKKLATKKETVVNSNIDAYIYDEAKDTLEVEDEDEDLDGEEAIIEDDDFEVYEEGGGWEEEKPTQTPTEKATESRETDDDELEELYDNKAEKKEEAIESPPPVKKEPKQERTSSEGKYLVVAGSFKSKRNARKKVKALDKEGFTGTIIQLEDSKLQTVIAGRFSTEVEAEDLMKEIKDSGLRAIVKEVEK